jgi:hypothetical protein
MSIRFGKYVRIVSGVGGSSGVQQRDLIGRLFSQNAQLSPDEVLEFTDAASVGEFFGTSSEEYKRAVFYFSYTSPSLGQARRISFARYAPSGAQAQIFGGKLATTLAGLQAVTAGVLTFSFDGAAGVSVSAINLSSAVSLSGVASLLTTALSANTDPNLDNATVSYDAVNSRFVFASGLVGTHTIALLPAGVGNSDLRTLLGWRDPEDEAIFTSGVAAQSVSDAFNAANNASNNFGSFVFVGNDSLTLTQHAELAALNAGFNVTYQYMAPTTQANASTWSAALIGFAGTALTLAPIPAGGTRVEFPEMVPMIQLAATDYSKRNAVVNYMFKTFGGLTPSVSDDVLSDTLDELRVNYYGRTQTAGQHLEFYQRGVLMGPTSAPLDMNVYGNEQWLKDSVGAALMGLLMGSNRIPANASGRGQILAVVQESIDAALLNGTISVGKTLTSAQKVFVTQQTGDELAWHQVQNVGYWVDAVIVPYVGAGGVTEYKAVYTLLYSKDDAVRLVEGSHFLI